MEKKTKTGTFTVTAEEAGERLDKVLAKRYALQNLSRSYFSYLLEEKKVLLNKSHAKKRTVPKAGDLIEVEFELTPEISLEAENIPLNIIYEDEYFLIINKPAGTVVHPAAGHRTGTLVNALLYHCSNHLEKCAADEADLRPGIVHRLDKDTSGLLIAAKTLEAKNMLQKLFRKQQIEKEYHAVCIGNPGSKEIDLPIGRHPTHRKTMAVSPDKGKPAKTICKTVKFDGKLSFVALKLVTGRTHQIRVHMKHLGTPILGDQTYGSPSFNKKYGVDRQMLHARRVKFFHPVTGKEIECIAPYPLDMKKILKYLS